MWPITLSGRLPIAGLVGRYLTNYLIGRELTPNRISPFTPRSCDLVVLCGISRCFHLLSPCLGQIAHALLTRPPLEYQPSGRNLPINIPARLACVKHAASVRPEPGSNSDVQSFSCLPVPLNRLAKARLNSLSNKRLTHSNLTVSCTVCLHYLYRFQGSCRRFQRFTVARDNIWDCITSPPPCQPHFSTFSIPLHFWLICAGFEAI